MRENALQAFQWLRSQFQPPAMEVDGVDEVLLVPETAGRILHPLNLRVDRLAGGIGDSMSQVRDDVLEAPLHHPRRFDHRLEPAPCGPAVPPTEVLSGRPCV